MASVSTDTLVASFLVAQLPLGKALPALGQALGQAGAQQQATHLAARFHRGPWWEPTGKAGQSDIEMAHLTSI